MSTPFVVTDYCTHNSFSFVKEFQPVSISNYFMVHLNEEFSTHNIFSTQRNNLLYLPPSPPKHISSNEKTNPLTKEKSSYTYPENQFFKPRNFNLNFFSCPEKKFFYLPKKQFFKQKNISLRIEGTN